MSRIEPDDLNRLQVSIAAILDHVEAKYWPNDILRELHRVWELKVCLECLCDIIVDEKIALD
ncbi:MAG: hypothetical protein N2C14_05130, partial [Planctomycetales bacterium]